MFCSNCGTKLNKKGLCPSCNPSFFNRNFKKITIISLLCIVIVLLLINLNSESNIIVKNDSRTIMMYLDGNTLESDNGILSHELSTIDVSQIDLSNTNIILYTGSTKKWHNYIKNDSNGLYKLTENGFELIKSEEKKSFGDASTLSDFINYVTSNFSASKYDLLIYDHGGAIDGAAYDEFSGDGLTLEEMSTALGNTSFNNKNKLESIIFRTCLNGGLEIANTFKDYANYLIASEQISYGSPVAEVLNFVNDVNISDGGREIGNNFLEHYQTQMDKLDLFGTIDYTYSIVDLSKIDNVNTEINNFFKNINLASNYSNVAQVRANLYQFGSDSNDYDTVDLYTLVNSLSKYSTYDSTKVLNAIKDAIVNNISNIDSANGISIYFPFKGKNGMKTKFLDVYKKLNNLSNYNDFINQFNSLQKNPTSSYSFNISENKEDVSDGSDNVKLDLTEEEANNFAYSRMAIFKQMEDHPNYYTILHITDDVTLVNNQLVGNYKNRLIKMESEGSYNYIYTLYLNSQKGTLQTNGILYDNDKSFSDDGYMNSSILYFDNDNGNPVISRASLVSDNDYVNGTFMDLSNYETLDIMNHSYIITDDDGNVLKSDDWESTPVKYGYEDKLSDVKFKYSSLDDDGKYVAVFIVHDIYGNISYSKLIEVK